MGEETSKGKVIFGEKAKEEKRNIAYPTSCQPAGRATIKVTKCSVTEIQTGYKKVNFADQRKEEAYRRINKMLRG